MGGAFVNQESTGPETEGNAEDLGDPQEDIDLFKLHVLYDVLDSSKVWCEAEVW